jgi:putative transposase
MHHGVLREAKAIRFKFIEEHQNKVPIQWLCQIMNVSARGYRAYRRLPISQNQRTDMVLLAHIRDQFA